MEGKKKEGTRKMEGWREGEMESLRDGGNEE